MKPGCTPAEVNIHLACGAYPLKFLTGLVDLLVSEDPGLSLQQLRELLAERDAQIAVLTAATTRLTVSVTVTE